jgi:hypothetical protein
VPRDARLETPLDLVAVAREHLGRSRAVIEAHERLGHDEAALGKAVAGVRQGDGRLERRDVVVGDVAHHGQPERLGLVERHEPGARTHPRRATEAPALDRLEQEARTPHPAQPEVRPERGEEVGGDGRVGDHRCPETKETSVGGLGRDGWGALG